VLLVPFFALGMLIGIFPERLCEQCKILFVHVDEWEGMEDENEEDTSEEMENLKKMRKVRKVRTK